MFGQTYTGWNALADLGKAIIQRNQQKAQTEALANLDSTINQPAPTDMKLNTAGLGQGLLNAGQQFNTLGKQFGIDQTGLLSQSKAIADNILQQTQQPQQASPFQASLSQGAAQGAAKLAQNVFQAGAASPPEPVPPTVQVPRDYRTNVDAMRDILPNMRTAMSQLVKAGYSPQDAYQIAHQKAREMADARVRETADRHAVRADDELSQAFASNNPNRILWTAQRHASLANRYGFKGADYPLIREAMKLGAKDFRTIQEDGDNVIYAMTPDGQMTEIHRSKPGLTPGQREQFALQKDSAALNWARFNRDANAINRTMTDEGGTVYGITGSGEMRKLGNISTFSKEDQSRVRAAQSKMANAIQLYKASADAYDSNKVTPGMKRALDDYNSAAAELDAVFMKGRGKQGQGPQAGPLPDGVSMEDHQKVTSAVQDWLNKEVEWQRIEAMLKKSYPNHPAYVDFVLKSYKR